MTDGLPLRIANEHEILPEFSTAQQLMRPDVIAGQCTLMPPLRISENQTSFRQKGGPATPPWWETDQTILQSGLHLFRRGEVFYYPRFGVIVSGAGEVMKYSFGEAKFVLGDISRLPFCRDDSEGPVLEPPRGVKRIDAAIVTMPWGGIHNYGHFLIDCMPSVAVCRQIASLAHHTFLFPPLEEWQRRHLALAGLSAWEELSDEIYLIGDAVWTSCLNHFLHSPNTAVNLLRSIQLLNCTATPPAPGGASRKIWLSRKGNIKRSFPEEDELEIRLERAGFLLYEPGRRPVEDQICVLAQANVVAGFTGAAFANVLYCTRSAKIIEIQPSLTQGVWVRNLAALVGADWYPFFCKAVPPANPVVVGGLPRPEIGSIIDLDIEEFLAFVNRFG